MSPTELVAVLKVVPFQPFRLLMSNNAVYDITNRGLLLVGNGFVHIGIPATPGDPVADRIVRIDPIHITELIPLATSPAVSGNGQPHD